MEWDQPHWSGRQRRDTGPRRKLRPNGFARLARAAASQAYVVIAFHVLIALACGGFAAALLSVDPDADVRITLDERTAIAQAGLDRQFPNIGQTFLAIVEDRDGLVARERALAMAASLAAQQNLFAAAFVPGTGPFYDRYGLLFLDYDGLRSRVDEVLQRQPMFHALASAPGLKGLSVLVAEIARAVAQGRSPPGLETFLLAAADTVEGEVAGISRPIDWTKLAGLKLDRNSPRWFVVATPRPGVEREAAIAAQRGSAGGLGVLWLWPQRALGTPPNPLRDFLVPAGLSAFLGILLLAAGLGSFRLTFAVLLACGVSASVAAAAAAALGRPLDQATWSFVAAAAAPALVGGIVLCIGYQHARGKGTSVHQSVMLAAHRHGGLAAVFVCIFASFWVAWLLRQLPSLSHFAVIALAGAAAAIAATLTLVPAVIAALEAGGAPAGPHWIDEALAAPPSHHSRNAGQVAAMVVLAAAVFCAAFVPGIRFGERHAPASPGALLDTPDARGAVHIVVKPEEADAVVASLASLPETGAIRTIAQFMPPDAAAKTSVLRLLGGAFEDLPNPRHVLSDGTAAESLQGLESELASIAASPSASADLRTAAQRLRRAVQQFGTPESLATDRVDRLEMALFGGLADLPAAAARLAALAAPEIGDLEPGLRSRFVSAEGLWRVEVMPRPGTGALSFAAAMRRAHPQAAGEPIAALTRNEIVHHETWLALATAFAATAVIVLAGLRTIGGFLAALLPAACLVTGTAAAAVGLGLVFTSAMLAAASAATALVLCCAMAMAQLLMGERTAGPTGRGAALRAGLLPLVVMAGAVVPLALSTRPAVRDIGGFMAVTLVLAALLCLVLVPAAVRWTAQLDRRK